MRPLKPEEMCEQGNAACIAQRLATFHAADIHNVPKEPQVFQRLLTWYSKNLAACTPRYFASIGSTTNMLSVHCLASSRCSSCAVPCMDFL